MIVLREAGTPKLVVEAKRGDFSESAMEGYIHQNLKQLCQACINHRQDVMLGILTNFR